MKLGRFAMCNKLQPPISYPYLLERLLTVDLFVRLHDSRTLSFVLVKMNKLAKVQFPVYCEEYQHPDATHILGWEYNLLR